MSNEVILQFSNIVKQYPGVIALDDVTLSFVKGEVHAIVGENGAGKSTLMKVLTGAIAPNKGQIVLFDKSYSKLEPHQAMELGVSVIYQEFNLVPFLTVAENIFYGREIMNGPFIDKKQMNAKTAELCREMGVTLNPKRQVKDLGVAYQQIVEIVKAVSQDAKILIMDEPSAPLTNNEIDAMFKVVRTLKQKGVTVLYITHRIEEIFEICDRVSIMRDGKYITTSNTNNTSRQEIIAHMVGRELGEDFPEAKTKAGKTVLEAKNISTDSIVEVSFQLRKGEILGFGGLVGSGRTETMQALFGIDKVLSGSVMIDGRQVNIRSPKDAIRNGLGLIPEDRKQQGLVLGMQIKENISYGILDKISTGSFVKTRKENEICTALRDELRIKTPTLRQKVRNLSGGNQQKVVLAKWIAMKCDVLIFDEPTRGIDVGAKQEIHNLMRELTAQGKSIIMISSEMSELIGMSDRIVIMSQGRLVGELQKEEYSQQRIMDLASQSESDRNRVSC